MSDFRIAMAHETATAAADCATFLAQRKVTHSCMS
jgi:hypothetical protein